MVEILNNTGQILNFWRISAKFRTFWYHRGHLGTLHSTTYSALIMLSMLSKITRPIRLYFIERKKTENVSWPFFAEEINGMLSIENIVVIE